MIQDLFEYTEQWAQLHPEIQHVPGKGSPNRRFFLTMGFSNMTDFLKEQTARTSPCIVMESGAPISGTRDGYLYQDYTIYFCVRSPEQMQTLDGPEAKACKEKAKDLALEFVDTALKMNKQWRMRGVSMHIEEDFSIEPYGPFWNWWYAAQLTLRAGTGMDTCIGDEMAEKMKEFI